MRMGFGKYENLFVADVPTGYLQWVLRECENADDRLRDAIRRELEHRRDYEQPSTREQPAPRFDMNALVQSWFRELAMKYHPDRSGNNQAMAAIIDAKELLIKRLKELT